MELIINALKKMVLSDITLEQMLTKVRKNICDEIDKNKEYNNTELQFLIALGEQCFLNEYVYSFTEKENKSVNNIM